MPKLNSYEFNALKCIAEAAHVVFVEAKLRSLSDVERYAGRAEMNRARIFGHDHDLDQRVYRPISLAECVASASAEQPEKLASLADAYLTAMSDRLDLIIKVYALATERFGNADLAGRLQVIMKAHGLRPAE
jgi:hypothetical protein